MFAITANDVAQTLLTASPDRRAEVWATDSIAVSNDFDAIYNDLDAADPGAAGAMISGRLATEVTTLICLCRS